jgi:peptidoglycan/xylan/chitin deacetylase (PgdA/CDA1 family)
VTSRFHRQPEGGSASPAVRALSAGALAAASAGALAHFAPGAVAWRKARCRFLPGLSGVGRADHVALTFDDGPDDISTPIVLDALDAFDWRATFFCLGSQARRHPEMVAEVVARGHEIGVHGFDHRSHLRRAAPGVIRDVAAARDLLEEVSGQEMRWFRPPYGAVAAPTLMAARATGLRLILWTTWGMDWKREASAASVAANVTRTFVPGATVLLHDTDLTSAPESWKATVEALPLLAGQWHGRQLEVGPLSDHF